MDDDEADDTRAFELDPETLSDDPRFDLLALAADFQSDVRAGRAVGLIAVTIQKHGTRYRYSFKLGGVACKYLTYAAGAMDVCAGLLRQRALKEAGML